MLLDVLKSLGRFSGSEDSAVLAVLSKLALVFPHYKKYRKLH